MNKGNCVDRKRRQNHEKPLNLTKTAHWQLLTGTWGKIQKQFDSYFAAVKHQSFNYCKLLLVMDVCCTITHIFGHSVDGWLVGLSCVCFFGILGVISAPAHPPGFTASVQWSLPLSPSPPPAQSFYTAPTQWCLPGPNHRWLMSITGLVFQTATWHDPIPVWKSRHNPTPPVHPLGVDITGGVEHGIMPTLLPCHQIF